MKKTTILFYGAGAIGSTFAGKIAEKGYDVTILARGNRLKQLTERGIELKNALTHRETRVKVPVKEILESDDIYDFIIVCVQYTQIDPILPILARNKSRNIVFVVNNPMGYQKWIDAVGSDKVIIGFPSVGGERVNGVVHYFVGRGLSKIFQATTFGELTGVKTSRLNLLLKIFRDAGFSPEMNSSMDSWQKTHIAVVLPIAKALYRFDSNNYRLSKSFKTIKKMILATRECFLVLKSLGYKINPGKLNFYYFPVFILGPVYMILFNTKISEFAMAKHTIVAQDEMIELEKAFKTLLAKSNVKTPHFDSL